MRTVAILRSALIAVTALLCGLTSANSQAPYETYHVSDWHDLVPQRRVEFQSYRTIVLSNGTLSDDEKARRIAAKFTELQNAVRADRLAAYEAVAESHGVGNSCTNAGSSPKRCKSKCAGSNFPDMFTQASWAKGAYKSGGDPADARILRVGNPVAPASIVSPDGAQICAIELKQSGHGRKVSYSQAEFRIRPATIRKLVDAEVPLAMSEITKSPI